MFSRNIIILILMASIYPNDEFILFIINHEKRGIGSVMESWTDHFYVPRSVGENLEKYAVENNKYNVIQAFLICKIFPYENQSFPITKIVEMTVNFSYYEFADKLSKLNDDGLLMYILKGMEHVMPFDYSDFIKSKLEGDNVKDEIFELYD